MSGVTSHLNEERLFDSYLARCAEEAVDPRIAEHLIVCADCAGRYDDLARFMDQLREDADAELDTVYSADQLRQQQQQIAKRLELVGRSARVLPFPQHTAPRQLPTTGRRAFPRWVAATAAAGLFAGVGAGLFFERAASWPVAGTAIRALDANPTRTPSSVSLASDGHERFMSELEMAADRPGTAELAAYDALTPHAREIAFTLSGR
ncbi:MAG: hypothetical protein AB7N65_00105 [Vicinamibacterales bacterium]